jgi:hypothetical protein
MLIAIAAILGVLAWVACGVLAYGLYFAYFQRKWPSLAEEHYDTDRGRARWWLIGGPLALLGALIAGGTEYGLKFR